MLYHLFYEQLFQYFSPFRVFGYITVRTAFASMTALGLGLILGPWLIRKLRDFQIGQFIREDGPESHHDKAGTPTMGGLLITVSIVLPTLLWANLTNIYVWIALFGLVGFGGIGFLDDYTKIRRGQNLGLTVGRKILLQVLVTLAIGSSLVWLFSRGDYDARLVLPFAKNLRPSLVIEPLLGNPYTFPLAFIFFFVFLFLVLVGCSNAVNLTDGLDGLAIGLTVICAGALTVLSYIAGHREFAQYLDVARVPAAAELTIFCGSWSAPAWPSFGTTPTRPRSSWGCRVIGDRRRVGHGRHSHQAGDPADIRCRRVRVGGPFGDSASRQLQTAWQADFQDGPLAPSLRGAGLAGIEDHCPLLDRRFGLGAIRAQYVEAAMNLENQRVLVVGLGESGRAAARFSCRAEL